MMAWWLTGLIALCFLSSSVGFIAGCAWQSAIRPRPHVGDGHGIITR